VDYGENETEFFPPALFSKYSVLLRRDTWVTETPRYKKNRLINIAELWKKIICVIFTLVLADTLMRMLALNKQRSTIHQKH